MNVSAEQAELIADSHARFSRMAEDYAALFYHRLFDRHPFARSLFPDDMTRQVIVFRASIDALVEAIDDLPSLRPTLADLARRHVQYGVKPHHYPQVGTVLIDTFDEMSPGGFPAETRAAWEALYADVARIMLAAAYPPA
ncbi:hypothetical protein ASG29_03050 [Sphingomonas sp. Leaf412]|uniref:globin domain-containing protein n=1 Tax=Sphingomonas sp. Leaf412 TaxID=1736370 RepID=UPI0006F542D4|nr:globin domain-containing protein [Sphingomonas sp. Leaf412]KQT35116.1 hypothetical protein ASG29_03050 [Sphingomonas sp. Leaf412]